MEEEFRTFRGYSLESRNEGGLTPSMEDYLEMLYRIAGDRGYARVNDLAAALNVQPPSVSKAVRRLAADGYLNYQPYGILELTTRGKGAGKALLERHQLVEKFLAALGVETARLEDTERIEHLLSDETLRAIFEFVEYTKDHPPWLDQFHRYRASLGG